MKLNFVILFFLFFSYLNIRAQDPYVEVIDASKGLMANDIYDIKQDKIGFIWLATDKGLIRFDGTDFTLFQDSLQTSFAGSNIQTDHFGRIWYENFDGYVYYVENEKVKTLANQHPLSFIPFGLTDSILYLVQKNGIDLYDLKTLQKIKSLPIHPKISYGMACGTQHKFYCIVDYELIEIDSQGKLRKRSMVKDFSNLTINLYNFDNKLYFAPKFNEKAALYEIDESLEWKPVLSIKTIPFIQNISKIDKYYWVASPNGMYRLSKNHTKKYFDGTNISCSFQDKQGNYWIGSIGKGLFFVSDMENAWMDLKKYQAQVMIKTQRGCLIGANYSCMIEVDSLLLQKSIHSLDKQQAQVYYLFQDSIHSELFYSSSGFDYISTGYKKHWTMAVKEMVRIDKKYIAVAASGFAKIVCLHPNLRSDWDSFFHKNQIQDFCFLLKNYRAKSIVYDSKSRGFYIATNTGLFYVDEEGKREIQNKGEHLLASQLKFIENQLIILDTKGKLWRLTKSNTFELIDLTQTFEKIKESNNQIYLIAGKNIYHWNPLKGKPMLLAKFNNHSPVKDFFVSNKEIYVLNYEGLLRKSLQKIQETKLDSCFYIHPIIKGSQIFPIDSFFTLQPDSNALEIQFSIFDYKHLFSHEIRYKINQHAWEILGENQKKLSLAALEPGNYEIIFEWNGKIQKQKICFEILKPFYSQVWFFILIACVFVGITYVLYRYQIKKLRQENEFMQERAQLLLEKEALEKNLSKSILSAVKSQMNPHFFYNALNTIQAYIFTNEKTKASLYLSKFSKLTRLILENSEKEYITLAEEMYALQLYLELENMRFSENFQYEIINHCHDMEIEIPPALIQPYIENAIKHGLLHKKGQKKLQIRFEEKDEFLQVSIQDNGIGRKRANELNQIKQEKVKSFSTDANAKRLDILNQGKNNKVSLVITDLLQQNQAVGTLVELSIPIHKI